MELHEDEVVELHEEEVVVEVAHEARRVCVQGRRPHPTLTTRIDDGASPSSAALAPDWAPPMVVSSDPA